MLLPQGDFESGVVFKKTFKNLAKLYGIYGVLHVEPLEQWLPKVKKVVEGLGKYKFKKIAANHCAGRKAIHHMVELGYPVVKGTGRHGLESKEYIGNGDTAFFDVLFNPRSCKSKKERPVPLLFIVYTFAVFLERTSV